MPVRNQTPSRNSPQSGKEMHAKQRRSQVRGLLLLAAAALLFAILRAGVTRAFNPGWWRLW
ncbi:MAG TPA: hypothetical protein VJU82_11350 [Acidobacteriaceae bacterium]|nr:hypothetical protein [Acidobacteriaceae bacterium]